MIMVFMKPELLFVESSMSWVYRYDLETKSFCNFHYNENPVRALNTTSLKCCLPSTDAIGRWEKNQVFVWRFKVASCRPATMKSSRFSQNKIRSDTFLTLYSIPNYLYVRFSLLSLELYRLLSRNSRYCIHNTKALRRILQGLTFTVITHYNHGMD